MILKDVIYSKLPFFDQEDRVYLQKIISTHKCCKVSGRDEYILMKIWKSVNQTTSDYSKQLLIDLVERLYIEGSAPVFHLAAKGENIKVDITLRSGDSFLTNILLARSDETKAPLSDETLEGTSDPLQSVNMIGINLPSDEFHKVIIVTEEPTGGVASGDVTSLIAEIYLYITETLDSGL